MYENVLLKQTYYITKEGRRSSSIMDDDVGVTFKIGIET